MSFDKKLAKMTIEHYLNYCLINDMYNSIPPTKRVREILERLEETHAEFQYFFKNRKIGHSNG